MNIEFIPSDYDVELYVPAPKPSKSYIPEWYKNISAFDLNKVEFDQDGNIANGNVKMCMPFFDSYNLGYIQETWQDIHFEINNNGEVVFAYPRSPHIVRMRDRNHVDMGEGFYSQEFSWRMPWVPVTPKGYSVIITQPFNQTLPFQTLTGVIDSDVFHHTPFGSTPFYLKNTFKGVIPAGTPMYQIIPIKRESWNSKNRDYNEKDQKKRYFEIRKSFYAQYKKMFWNKKDYS